MNNTPHGTRLHIALFGRRNAGKSSLVNALTQQDIALVSDTPGTTTDPVYKGMELLPLGPVMLIDTAGLDDEGPLGEMRAKKSLRVLEKTDVALIVTNLVQGYGDFEADIVAACQKRNIPFLVIFTHADCLSEADIAAAIDSYQAQADHPYVITSAVHGQGISAVKSALAAIEPKDFVPQTILGDLLQPQDVVVLVTPIDDAAPKGRLILPQVQVLRDILDHHAIALTCQVAELTASLAALQNPPALVITDSQAFHEVSARLAPTIPLTSFSILMARYKGDLPLLSAGADAISRLQPGDRILIAEGCTHHQQADDIGTVKIPRLLEQYVGGPLHFDFAHGTQFPEALGDYQLVIHCGGCMLNRKEMLYRLSLLENAHIPITNYGVLLAELNGILSRSLAPLQP